MQGGEALLSSERLLSEGRSPLRALKEHIPLPPWFLKVYRHLCGCQLSQHKRGGRGGIRRMVSSLLHMGLGIRTGGQAQQVPFPTELSLAQPPPLVTTWRDTLGRQISSRSAVSTRSLPALNTDTLRDSLFTWKLPGSIPRLQV